MSAPDLFAEMDTVADAMSGGAIAPSRTDLWIVFKQVMVARQEDIPEGEWRELFELWCDHRNAAADAHNAKVFAKVDRIYARCDRLRKRMERMDPHQRANAKARLWSLGKQAGELLAPRATPQSVPGVTWVDAE